MRDRVRVLVHSSRRFGKGKAFETPMDELKTKYNDKEGITWHWTFGANGLKDDDEPQTLLMTWEGKVFGEADATITRDIDDDWRNGGYNFAFNIKKYANRRKSIPLKSITKRRPQQGGTFALHEDEIERYRRLR